MKWSWKLFAKFAIILLPIHVAALYFFIWTLQLPATASTLLTYVFTAIWIFSTFFSTWWRYFDLEPKKKHGLWGKWYSQKRRKNRSSLDRALEEFRDWWSRMFG
jgi:hypothetical protein